MLHHIHKHCHNFLMTGIHRHPILLAGLVLAGGVAAVKVATGTNTAATTTPVPPPPGVKPPPPGVTA